MKLHEGRASKELLWGGYMSLISLDWELSWASSLLRFILIYKYANHSGLDWTTHLHKGARTPFDLLNSHSSSESEHTDISEEHWAHRYSFAGADGQWLGATYWLQQLSQQVSDGVSNLLLA